MKGSKVSNFEETRSSKRHRTKTNRFEIDFLDNDEQKHIQQAMRNSLIETRRIDIPTPSAPTYYPTVEEFHDVLKYISKIRVEASEYGICKIVPPKGWNPVCQINLSESNSKVFPTKLQDISTLQQGEGFEDGKYYTFANYRKMADQFTTDWSNKYYDGKKIPEEVSYDELAKDYWDIVETHTKQAIVEYGNDLDTDVFMSGFSTKGSTTNNSSSSSSNSKDHPNQNLNQYQSLSDNNSNSSNLMATSSSGTSSPSSTHTDTDNTTTTTPINDANNTNNNTTTNTTDNNNNNNNKANAVFSEDYYIKSGWNLTQLPTCSGSVLQHITTPINGVNVPWLYVGMLFSSFCWHNEDNYLFSMNYSHYGAPKQWYGVPASDTKRFEKVSKDFLLESFQESPDLLQHMTTQISPSLLQANGVKVYKTLQEAQTFIITFPKAFHCGFNHGFNINEAVNFATPDWLSLGAEAEEKYRLIARGSVFSHQRLLFTLLHHLTQQWDDEYSKQQKVLEINNTSTNTNNTTINTINNNTSNANHNNNTTYSEEENNQRIECESDNNYNNNDDDDADKESSSSSSSFSTTGMTIQMIDTSSDTTTITNNTTTTDTITNTTTTTTTATTNNNNNNNNNNATTTVTTTNTANANTTTNANTNITTSSASTATAAAPSVMSLEHQQALAHEIFKVVDEELVTRPVILAQGIKDISLQVKLPPNDFTALSKKALEYDDMRTCCICKHICVFSAIACECDRAKVTCIRHFSFMCKCARDKKFLLKWASDDYMRDIKKQMLRIMRSTQPLPTPVTTTITATTTTTQLHSSVSIITTIQSPMNQQPTNSSSSSSVNSLNRIHHNNNTSINISS